jgi:hypothetical protein
LVNGLTAELVTWKNGAHLCLSMANIDFILLDFNMSQS